MGYTHYWKAEKPRPFTQEEWRDIKTKFGALVAHLPETTKTAGGFFADSPLAVIVQGDPEVIWFEGWGKREKEDLSHETFVLEKSPGEFQCCKTARKPYDLLVCATLIMIHGNAPGVLDISSDGDAGDWKPALEYVRSVLGPDYELPPSITE